MTSAGARAGAASGGTALITPALRALPVGVPKLMVSTVAGGDVSGYVGASDIAMLHSVTDVAGLNRISRQVPGNARTRWPACSPTPFRPRPTSGGGADHVRGDQRRVSPRWPGSWRDRYDPLVFHAVGTGGRAMEKLVDDGQISAVLDITTTEICDLIAGGVFSAGPERAGHDRPHRVPYVGS